MICCEICSNFKNLSQEQVMRPLINKLIQHGEILWQGGTLMFSNTEDNDVNEDWLSEVLESCGLKKYFVDVFDDDHLPKGVDSVTWWAQDKIFKINYKKYEDASQECFRKTIKGLDMLDAEIHKLREIENKEKGGE